ncbi:conjugal transfer protein TraC [Pseudonocardia sp. HH130630-07]|nr:conjugal transfer protein TraC [Pseudonocardia sp. HH130630-07]
MRVAARRVALDGVRSCTLVVTGLPREVPGAGWLAPLTGHPGLADVSLHVAPIDPATAATRLRRQLARLEAGRRSGAEHGRLPDPEVDAATEDAHVLAERVARGEARLFTVTLTVTVTAPTEAGLDDELAAIRALLASLLMTGHPATWRAWHGWETGLPLGIDRIGTARILDTAALAAAFPFASPDLPPPSGPGEETSILIGHNLASSSLVFWDRWSLDNYNSVILGRSGAGKSYLVKLDVLRSLYTGTQVQVIDPEDEYTRLAEAVGGTVVRLGAPGVRVNPLDLDVHVSGDGARTAAPDALARRRLVVHEFLSLALSGGEALSASEVAVLDEAITLAYTRAGIGEDPATWTRPAPLLADLRAALLDRPDTTPGVISRALNPTEENPAGPEGNSGANGDAAPMPDPARQIAEDLARRLRPYADGSHAALFGGPTSHPPGGDLVVWSLKELPEALRPLGTMLVLDAVWRTVIHPHDRRRRLVVVDEAWMLLQHSAGARFLLRAAKSARKHWAGLVVATQDTADVLASDLGRAVITNSATQILLRQASQAIDTVSRVFGLSAGEQSFLLSAERGDGLLTGGDDRRVAFAALASAEEDALITTDPAQLADQHAASPFWIDLDRSVAAGAPETQARPW